MGGCCCGCDTIALVVVVVAMMEGCEEEEEDGMVLGRVLRVRRGEVDAVRLVVVLRSSISRAVEEGIIIIMV